MGPLPMTTEAELGSLPMTPRRAGVPPSAVGGVKLAAWRDGVACPGAATDDKPADAVTAASTAYRHSVTA